MLSRSGICLEGSVRPEGGREAPALGGGSGAARRCRQAIDLLAYGLTSTQVAATHHSEEFAEIPDGLNAILFSTYEEPNVVAYDSVRVSAPRLAEFANHICDHDHAHIEPVAPRLIQHIRGYKRAHIYCLGDPK